MEGDLLSSRFVSFMRRGLGPIGAVVTCCRYTVVRIRAGFGILDRRCSLRCSHGPVRDVGAHIGSVRDLLGGVHHGGVPLAVSTVRRGVRSVTNIHIVYTFRSSVCGLTGYFLSRSSMVLVRGGSCVTGPGPDNCEDLRLVMGAPVFLGRKGGVVAIRIRLHAVTVSF